SQTAPRPGSALPEPRGPPGSGRIPCAAGRPRCATRSSPSHRAPGCEEPDRACPPCTSTRRHCAARFRERYHSHGEARRAELPAPASECSLLEIRARLPSIQSLEDQYASKSNGCQPPIGGEICGETMLQHEGEENRKP